MCFADRFARQRSIETVAFGELMEQSIERHPIFARQYRSRVRRLQRVWITIAYHDFRTYEIYNSIQKASLQHPGGKFDADRWARRSNTQVRKQYVA